APVDGLRYGQKTLTGHGRAVSILGNLRTDFRSCFWPF
ncbi:MAG: hypothetical protein ACI88G_002025, partial [Woeseiaceae bacterium]